MKSMYDPKESTFLSKAKITLEYWFIVRSMKDTTLKLPKKNLIKVWVSLR